MRTLSLPDTLHCRTNQPHQPAVTENTNHESVQRHTNTRPDTQRDMWYCRLESVHSELSELGMNLDVLADWTLVPTDWSVPLWILYDPFVLLGTSLWVSHFLCCTAAPDLRVPPTYRIHFNPSLFANSLVPIYIKVETPSTTTHPIASLKYYITSIYEIIFIAKLLLFWCAQLTGCSSISSCSSQLGVKAEVRLYIGNFL